MLTPVIDTSKEYGLVLEGGGAEDSGCEQVRAPHSRRHGHEREISASEAGISFLIAPNKV